MNVPWEKEKGALKQTIANNREVSSKLTNLELTYFLNVSLWMESKANAGVIFITILLQFHYFISSETASTQKSEVSLLRISLGNVNASYVTCRYPSQQTFVLMKTSWRRLSSSSSEDVLIKTNMFALALPLQKTSSRPIYSSWIYVFKTSCQDVFKTLSRRL